MLAEFKDGCRNQFIAEKVMSLYKRQMTFVDVCEWCVRKHVPCTCRYGGEGRMDIGGGQQESEDERRVSSAGIRAYG